MTTTIKVEACCGDDKEVVGKITENGVVTEGFTIQDGETKEMLVYDDREFTVREVEKTD